MLQELKTILTTLFTVALVGGGLYLWQGQAAASPNRDYSSMIKVLMVADGEEQGHGSGVIIGPNTFITAKHVDAPGITMVPIDASGKKYTVTKVEPTDTDMVIVTVKETFDITPAKLVCREQVYGASLFIVGWPLDFDKPLVFLVNVAGYTEAGPGTSKEEETTKRLLVTGVALPGDSGGPVFDMAGKVVGILVGEMMYGDGRSNEDSDVNIVIPFSSIPRLCGMA